jgi:hypothetical protein
MFYLSLLLILWIHIFSPRGIYKYYTVVLVPFFSILAVSEICKRNAQEVKVSIPMLVTPFILAIAIMVPDRNLYILYLILIFIGYVLHSAFSDTYRMVAGPITRLIIRIRGKTAKDSESQEPDMVEPLERT